jgi:transposase
MTPLELELARQLAQCQQELQASRRENELLRHKINWLVRRVFGASGEQLDQKQLELLLQLPVNTPAVTAEPAVTPIPPVTVSRTRKERGPRLPDNLPVVEVVIDPEPVKAAPQNWRCIGEEVSEQLDYEPGHFLRRRTVRRKYVQRVEVDTVPIIAPLPACLLERGLAAPGLLAYVLVSKYCDHLPLYRLEQIFRHRYEVHLPRQTLARWVALAADWRKPIYDQIRTGVLAGGYVQMDETPIDYLEPGYGRARQGYLWTGSCPGGDVFFHWETSRATACLEHVITVDFTGTLQADGDAAYRSFVDKRGAAIQLAGCWAHVRRKIFEALEASPRLGGWLLRQIQHLYQVEAAWREQHAGPQLREAVRAHQSRPIIERLKRVLDKLQTSGRFLPKSPLEGAIDYALGQWQALTVYLTDGRVEIDNNNVENAIRPTAIGKKNWLFVGEAEAGERGAIIYTIIESCRRRNLDPYAYLKDVLTRLPHMTNWQISEVLPATWGKPPKPAQAAA